MKKWLNLMLVLMIVPHVYGQSDKAPIKMQKYVGQSIVIPVENADTVVIDRRDIVNYKDPNTIPPDEPNIILDAVGSGVAFVTATKDEETFVYEINITSPIEDEIVRLAGTKNVKVRVISRQARFSMQPTVANDTPQQEGQVQASAPGMINQAPVARTSSASLTNSDLDATIILEGEVEDDFELKKLLGVAYSFSSNVLNFVSINNPLQVRIKAQVVSVTSDKLSNIGITYGPQGADGLAVPLGIKDIGSGMAPWFRVFNQRMGGYRNPALSAGDPVASSTEEPFDISAVINLAVRKGYAKILQEPTLTVLNGQAASFNVGSRIPISSARLNEQGNVTGFDVTYQDAGVSMHITPIIEEEESLRPNKDGTIPSQTMTLRERSKGKGGAIASSGNNAEYATSGRTITTIDPNGLIKLLVRPEISSPDFSRTTATNPNPIFNTRVVETRVAMKDKESLIIGGLFDENLANTTTEVPFASKIPIFGELFTNRRKQGTSQEVIFILTPNIVGREDIKRGDKVKPKLQDTDDYLREKNLPVASLDSVKISNDDVTTRIPEAMPLPDAGITTRSGDVAVQRSGGTLGLRTSAE
jgi:Flp pilus assembly secretin CpaC